MIELDRRRQKNREACRALKLSTTDNNRTNTQPGERVERIWCVYGNSFISIADNRALDIISKEQEVIEKDTEDLRRRMKKSMQELSALEGRKSVQDFDLKPLTKTEKDAIHKIIGDATLPC
ncbi:p53 and DNA damage-regulated protein 1-like [Tropilaelaps mercedesae]|uniref:p53 and DNA damage-regulated protein 1-like n=1 Tax=Tropilaelaps mercedesae TaxID=418985 RepID=A0A1V9Y3T5_9ACAR|nr:p53 and DNA damage-regulated protein 1-like [Tropilaelaps mercedesae]